MRRPDAYNYPEREADLRGVVERMPHRIKWAVSGNHVTILQERFDMCTPPSTAFAFKAAVPHAVLRIVENARHMPTEHDFLRDSTCMRLMAWASVKDGGIAGIGFVP